MSKTRFSHAAIFGTASSIAVIILSLLIYLLELPEVLNFISYGVVITFLCVGVKKWRDQGTGYLTFGETYKHLMLQSLVYCIFMTIWAVVFSTFIAPGLAQDRLLIERAKMEDKGLPQETIDMAMSWAEWAMQPVVIAIMTLVGGMIIYALFNLILAAIMKKDPPPAQFFPPANAPFPSMPPQGGQQNFSSQQNNPPQQ